MCLPTGAGSAHTPACAGPSSLSQFSSESWPALFVFLRPSLESKQRLHQILNETVEVYTSEHSSTGVGAAVTTGAGACNRPPVRARCPQTPALTLASLKLATGVGAASATPTGGMQA